MKINLKHMKQTITVMTATLALVLAGCKRDGTAGAPTGIDGTYVEQDSPDIQLILKNGKYQQGASDVHDEGTFTARKLDENIYELVMVSSNPDFKDLNPKHTFKRHGDLWVLKEITADGTPGDEQTFKKK